MAWPATISTKFQIFGDSITHGQPGVTNGGPWHEQTGGFDDQLFAALSVPAATGQYGIVTGKTATQAVGSTSSSNASTRQNNVHAYGIGGWGVAQLLDYMPAGLLSLTPFDICILEIGTNDFGTASAAYLTFLANYALLLDLINAAQPSCKILCLSMPVRVETWTAVGPHFVDGSDTWPGTTGLAALCAARASYCEYVDLLAPALAYEMINNTPAPGISPGSAAWGLTYDSLHPTPIGKVLMGTTVMSHLSLS